MGNSRQTQNTPINKVTGEKVTGAPAWNAGCLAGCSLRGGAQAHRHSAAEDRRPEQPLAALGPSLGSETGTCSCLLGRVRVSNNGPPAGAGTQPGPSLYLQRATRDEGLTRIPRHLPQPQPRTLQTAAPDPAQAPSRPVGAAADRSQAPRPRGQVQRPSRTSPVLGSCRFLSTRPGAS